MLLASACSTTSVTFKSTPNAAEIFVKPLEGGAERSIGRTPLTLSASALNKGMNGAGPLKVEFRLDGYRTSRVIVTELSSIDLTIQENLDPMSGLEDPQQVNQMIDQLFSVQDNIRNRNYPAALGLIAQLKSQMPQLSSIYEFEGGIKLLQKDYRGAFDAYRTAITLNPKSPYSRLMQKKVERFLKERTPAGI